MHSPSTARALVIGLVAVTLVGCPEPKPKPNSPSIPVVFSFRATPSTIDRGQSSTLQWSVSPGTTVALDQGLGDQTGKTATVTPTDTTEYTLTATNEGGVVTSKVTVTVNIPVVVGPSMLLTSMAGGASMLGEMSTVPLDTSAAVASFHSFAGTPWLDDSIADSHGLAWNAADNKFYGVLNGGGAFHTGVVVSFDPSTDALVMLKTLSGREYPDAPVIDGGTVPFSKMGGFFRKPLPTLDGKGLLLMANYAGVDERGVLVHVNIDPTSPNYLKDTVVYDFYEHELSQGNHCEALRGGVEGGQSELAWGKDGTGADVVFLARGGTSYDVSAYRDPTKPGNCHRATVQGVLVDEIRGRMFAVKPTDSADPSKPWAYALGVALPIDPFLRLGRQTYWDAHLGKIRWATETKGGGEFAFYEDLSMSNNSVLNGGQLSCFRLGGILPLDTASNALATCGGAYAGITDPAGNVSPRLMQLSATGVLTEKIAFRNWTADAKFIYGATSSLDSHRVFVNGGYSEPGCYKDNFGCVSPATLEEIDPGNQFARSVLVTADPATTGNFFLGDPAVGGALTEPIADRYIVWFGAEVNGHSNTLNKYDRMNGKTVSLALDPVAGAHPMGRLLPLGDGTALGLMDRTVPVRGATEVDLPGGYAGNGYVDRSYPGFYVLDLSTRAVLKTLPVRQMEERSLEQVRLDDGSVWAAVSYFAGNYGFYRNISQLNLTTGALTDLAERQEAWDYAPVDPFTLAGRKSVLYLPFWANSVAPVAKHFSDVTLGCVRPGDGKHMVQSDPFGPAQAASGNAHRIVYGATFSPTNNAMYLATSKVGDADQGTIFEVDKGVADADLCKAKPVVTALVTALPDVPSTRLLSTRAGGLFYGTANGKLMKLDAAAKTVAMVADLKGTSATTSQVRGYLAETTDDVVALVVYDYDAAGHNTARRLVTVVVGTGAASSRDVTALLDESEPYPGVLRLN